MLDGLDEIDWGSLRHAYGSAADVPEQLRALASPDPARRDWAREKLFGNIFHQGTTYEASAYAVPFLLELAADDATPAREDVVYLLSDLAIGYDEYVLPHGASPDYMRDPTYAAVAEGVPLFRTLLRAGDDQLEAQAAHVAAWFPHAAAETLRALWRRLDDPIAPATAGACLAAIGLLGDRGDGVLAARLAPLLRHEDPVWRWGAAVALARIAGENPPDGAVDELLLAARGEVPELPEPGTVFLYGDVRGYAAESLQLLGASTRAAAVDAIVESLAASDMWTSLALVHGLLPLAFGARVPPGTPFAALEPYQQAALRGFLRAEWFVTGSGFLNVKNMLESFGLPGDAPALDAYIRGVPPPRPRRRRWWQRR